VDAVPYEVAKAVWEDGGLPGFGEPRRSVSVFPSLTEVAVPSLLRGIFSERPPGYESRYYHPPSGEIRGGFSDPASDAAMSPFRARPRGLLAHAAVYLLRGQLAYAQIRWITHRFQQEGGPWLGYLSATDGVGHFSGREGLARAFRDIALRVNQLRLEIALRVNQLRLEHQRQHGVLPGVVLCSDHGMSFGPLDHLAESTLADRLTGAGFRVGGRGHHRVVLVPYGDVGAGVVHVERESAPEVATAVASAPGVDLAFARVEGGCLVFGMREGLERARIRWRGGSYRYEAEYGDPLSYAGVWRKLDQAGKLHDGWADDPELFALSWSHPYPDALARVRCGLEDLVQYPASVLFSMRDDWTFGPALTHAGARLIGGQVGTHGALTSAQSIGFAAVTEDGGDPWAGAPALRPEDVFGPWRELVRAGSEPSPGSSGRPP
jgi:hypothetical protein